MITVKEIESNSKNYINKIAELHKNAFPTFFLSQLGHSFLCALYSGYLEDKDSGIIIAENESKLIGFIAYSNDYSKFYKRLIKNHLFKFAACSICAAIKHPSFIKRLLRAFKKSEKVARNERYVQLASLCVDPQLKRKGLGSALVSHLKKMVDFSMYAYINLETDAEKNDDANKFYSKNGFRLERTYVTPEGRKMNEYRYRGIV